MLPDAAIAANPRLTQFEVARLYGYLANSADEDAGSKQAASGTAVSLSNARRIKRPGLWSFTLEYQGHRQLGSQLQHHYCVGDEFFFFLELIRFCFLALILSSKMPQTGNFIILLSRGGTRPIRSSTLLVNHVSRSFCNFIFFSH